MWQLYDFMLYDSQKQTNGNNCKHSFNREDLCLESSGRKEKGKGYTPNKRDKHPENNSSTGHQA